MRARTSRRAHRHRCESEHQRTAGPRDEATEGANRRFRRRIDGEGQRRLRRRGARIIAALDEIARFRLNDDLLRVQSELLCTVVFVTHSVYESAYLSSRIAVMSPRPGRIVAEIEGELPGPRSKDFRTSARYARLCGEISQILFGQTAEERF